MSEEKHDGYRAMKRLKYKEKEINRVEMQDKVHLPYDEHIKQKIISGSSWGFFNKKIRMMSKSLRSIFSRFLWERRTFNGVFH